MFFLKKSAEMPAPGTALPGRAAPVVPAAPHAVFGRPLDAPLPEGMAEALFGMGCFWGAERLFWQTPGVWLTAVGYAGGETPNPDYEEVCSGRTGHAEVVRVAFDPAQVAFGDLLRLFWENHDPTQGMRQGNDVGTQYRSALYPTTPEQAAEAQASRLAYAARLKLAGLGPVTTEIRADQPFYFADDAHQQYLAKHPGGYCGLRGTGVACAAGAGA